MGQISFLLFMLIPDIFGNNIPVKLYMHQIGNSYSVIQ